MYKSNRYVILSKTVQAVFKVEIFLSNINGSYLMSLRLNKTGDTSATQDSGSLKSATGQNGPDKKLNFLPFSSSWWDFPALTQRYMMAVCARPGQDFRFTWVGQCTYLPFGVFLQLRSCTMYTVQFKVHPSLRVFLQLKNLHNVQLYNAQFSICNWRSCTSARRTIGIDHL